MCLGMVPLVAYNFGAENIKRMKKFLFITTVSALAFASICTILFFTFSSDFVGAFIKDTETVNIGARFLKGRCFALPFMIIGYIVVNYMNAINKGIISFILALLRHVVLLIPMMIIMNIIFGMNGLIQSQLYADVMNAAVAIIFLAIVNKKL